MKYGYRFLAALLAVFSLQLAACTQESGSDHLIELASTVDHIEGSEFSRVTLSERAIERIDLKTDEVREEWIQRSNAMRMCVPYSALIYDPQGRTWVYTSSEPRTFVRQEVIVDFIDGDLAVLTDGPPLGTVVASVGVAELYGTEFEVGH
jgi:hypothetical protein